MNGPADNTPACPVCGLANQVRGCEPGRCAVPFDENGPAWIPFTGEAATGLPQERRKVLVAVPRASGRAPTVCVGYLRYAAGDPRCPFFVTPGVDQDAGQVTHWADCLGDSFRSPGWAFGQPDKERTMSDEKKRPAFTDENTVTIDVTDDVRDQSPGLVATIEGIPKGAKVTLRPNAGAAMDDETKHSPGPWMWTRDPLENHTPDRLSAADGTCILEVPWLPRPEHRALIASAPTTADRLRRAVDLLREAGTWPVDYEHGEPLRGCAICGGSGSGRHAADCRLAAFLAEMDKG